MCVVKCVVVLLCVVCSEVSVYSVLVCVVKCVGVLVCCCLCVYCILINTNVDQINLL